MHPHGQEFLFEGQPAGLLEAGTAPTTDGSYAYEPFRGPGHYKLALELKRAGTARCCYLAGDQRVWFTVCPTSEQQVLELSAFQSEPAGAL